MRQRRLNQPSFFDGYANHEIGDELEAISDLLDQHPEILDLVKADLWQDEVKTTGRKGVSLETLLRCALLMQYEQLSYEELAFRLTDSKSFRTFARLEPGRTPKRSALHKGISAIRAETWEKINRILLGKAKDTKIETGDVVRIDSTASQAPIHEPTDNSLLDDAVRVMTRLLAKADDLAKAKGESIHWHNHERRAKRRSRGIAFGRKEAKRAKLYRDLIDVTCDVCGYLETALEQLRCNTHWEADLWRAEVAHVLPLVVRVIDQTERRVFQGETVPAQEKVVSLFEPHADIIAKGGRKLTYGHKLNLSSGKSNLILDLVIEDGNPADSSRFVPMLERHQEIYGEVPRQTSVDGGYASKDNLKQAKAMGVEDVAFHKKSGLKVEDMVKNSRVERNGYAVGSGGVA